MARKVLVLEQERLDLNAELATLDLSTDQGAVRLTEIETQASKIDAAIHAEKVREDLIRSAPVAQSHNISLHDNAEDKPFESFGHFMQAVAAAGTPGQVVDPRLFAAAPSGASAGSPSDGGFLIRTDYSTKLLNRGMEASQLAPLCDSVPISAGSDGLEAPFIDETNRATGSRWGGVQVYRRGEADTVTATKPKFGKFDLRLEDMMGLAYATERLLRDASAMEAVFSTAFASEFGFKLDNEIIRGTGAGECLGILNSSALVSVAAEGAQAAATVVTENLSKMWSRCYGRSRARAVWLYNQDVDPQLDQLAMAVGGGVLEPRFVTYGPDGVLRIKGRPMVAIEQAESLGTVGDIILADLSQYVLITKGGIQADQSIHVRFIYNERTFRWVYPINGAPKWMTPLIPFKGTGNTLSPFVVLATRS